MAKEINKSTEVNIARIFDAPRSSVWKAWTRPEKVGKWWGPKQFTAPHITIDLREEGRFLFSMRGAGPDGVVRDYWNTGTYRVIAAMKKIIMAMSFADEQGRVVPASHYGMPGEWPAEIMVAVTFADADDGKTKLTVRETGIPGEMTGPAGLGWEQQLDKLADLLAFEATGTRIIAEPGKQEIVLSRVFDAPRASVFRAYTDPDSMPHWWGPKRFATIVDRMEVRPGGIWRLINRDVNGTEYAFHGVYHEVRSPERLVSTFEFEGTPGRVSLETAMFEERDGKTLLTSRSVFPSVADRDEMLKEGMEEGAAETMDRLAELLAQGGVRRKAA